MLMVLNATELLTSKGFILCDVNFTSIEKKKAEKNTTPEVCLPVGVSAVSQKAPFPEGSWGRGSAGSVCLLRAGEGGLQDGHRLAGAFPSLGHPTARADLLASAGISFL